MSAILLRMKARYHPHRDANGEGWTVVDRTTGVVADFNGTRHENVPGEDIDELVDMLNAVEARQKAVSKKAAGLRLRIRRDRYVARRDAEGDGWSVWDNTTGGLAAVHGSASTAISVEDADDLVDMLNRIEARRA
jgi:hypothetical protein